MVRPAEASALRRARNRSYVGGAGAAGGGAGHGWAAPGLGREICIGLQCFDLCPPMGAHRGGGSTILRVDAVAGGERLGRGRRECAVGTERQFGEMDSPGDGGGETALRECA